MSSCLLLSLESRSPSGPVIGGIVIRPPLWLVKPSRLFKGFCTPVPALATRRSPGHAKHVAGAHLGRFLPLRPRTTEGRLGVGGTASELTAPAQVATLLCTALLAPSSGSQPPQRALADRRLRVREGLWRPRSKLQNCGVCQVRLSSDPRLRPLLAS